MSTKFIGFANAEEMAEYGLCSWSKAVRGQAAQFDGDADACARVVEVEVIRVIKPTRQKDGTYKFVRPKKES